jgi:hypothetical protein
MGVAHKKTNNTNKLIVDIGPTYVSPKGSRMALSDYRVIDSNIQYLEKELKNINYNHLDDSVQNLSIEKIDETIWTNESEINSRNGGRLPAIKIENKILRNKMLATYEEI